MAVASFANRALLGAAMIAAVGCGAGDDLGPAELRAVGARSHIADVGVKTDLHPHARPPTWTRNAPSGWDRNNDGLVSWNEWKPGLRRTGIFRSWDLNGDGLVEGVEVGLGLFASLDLDDDGAISSVEYRVGAIDWWGDAGRLGSMDALDGNADGGIDRDELLGALRAGGVLTAWDADADGTLHEHEFARALLATWDRDGDGFLGRWEGPTPVPAPRVAGFGPEP